MGCIGSKESGPQQPDDDPPVPFNISQLDGDAMAAQLFSTRRNPNRRRAPSPGTRARGPYQPGRPGPLYPARRLPETATHSLIPAYPDYTTARPSTGDQRQQLPPLTGLHRGSLTRLTRARLTEHSRHQIDPGDPGPYHSGLPILNSTDTLPRYEPRGEPAPVLADRPGTAASGSRVSEAGGGGLVGRVGTGWSAVTSHSGPPPSYHSVEPRQNTWRSSRG